MTELGHSIYDSEDGAFINVPKSALQSLYHAVTGKTENLSKEIKGNVIINSSDIDSLYGMIIDQFGVHRHECSPTVTILVKCANDKTNRYSSWEIFKNLNKNNLDITSEVFLKFETVLSIPDTKSPQRCIVNISIDSSLPIIVRDKEEGVVNDALGYVFLFGGEWPTVSVSIDFVDFVIAKSMLSVIEEWFSKLERMKNSSLNKFFFKNITVVRDVMNELGRIGAAIFIMSYAFFSNVGSFNYRYTFYCVAYALFLW